MDKTIQCKIPEKNDMLQVLLAFDKESINWNMLIFFGG